MDSPPHHEPDPRTEPPSALASESARDLTFARLADALDDGVLGVRGDGLVTYASPRAAELLGRAADELRGAPLRGLLDDPAGPAAAALHAALAASARWDREVRFRRGDGTQLPAHVVLAERSPDDGMITRLLLLRERSAEVERPEDRRRVEALNERILTSAPIGILAYDTAGRITLINDAFVRIGEIPPERRDALYGSPIEQVWTAIANHGTILEANQALADLLGYSRDELRQRTAAEITHPDDRSVERGLFRELVANPEGFVHLEKRYVRKDGAIIWGRLSLSGVRDDQGRPTLALALVEDVTDRVRLVEELTRSHEALNNVLEHLMVGVCISVHDRFVYANSALCRLLGYGDQEMLALSPETVVADWENSRLREVVDRLDAGRATEVRALARALRKDGTAVDVRVTAVVIRYHDAPADLFLVEDLSREQEQQACLAQAQVLHTIGLLAGGIAHDFNNLLTGFSAHASLLRGQVQRLGLDAHDVDGLERLIQRAAALTQKLLAFGRRQILRPLPLDVTRLVAEFVPVARRLLGERIRIESHLAGAPVVVVADPIQLEQVLLNLAVNARDAMPGGGVLTFEIRVEPADLELHTSGAAVLVVRDTGRGIGPEQLRHVFEPFFTTKALGAGTGLGLAVVYGIVEQHNGTIEVSSSLGEGTEFRVRLPLSAERPRAPESKAQPPIAVAPVGLRVLVAEDDDDLRHLIERVLTRAGYRVIPARDGVEAVEAFLRESDIALVLFDMVMPDLTGLEALDQIRKVDAKVPAVLVSGYSDDLVDGEGGRRDDLLFVPKPFSPAEILAAVAGALERTRSSP